MPGSDGIATRNYPRVHAAYKALAEGRLEDARRETSEALRLQPDHPVLHRLMAEILGKQDDWVGVERHLGSVLAAHPDDAYALAARGFARLRQNRPDEAEADFRKALPLSTDDRERAVIQMALDQIDADRLAAREPMPRAGGESPPEQLAGDIRQDNGVDAENRVDGQLRRNTENRLHLEAAESLAREQDWSGAEQRLSQYLASAPDHGYALAFRGYMLLNLYRQEAAEIDFRRALELELEPNLRSDVQHVLDQMERDRQTARNLELEDDFLAAAERQAKEHAAMLADLARRFADASQALREDRLDEALAQVDEMLQKNPDNAAFKQLRGEILVRRKDWPAAEMQFSSLLAADPVDAYALASRGIIRQWMNRFDEAERDLLQAASMSPPPEQAAAIDAALEQIARARSAAADETDAVEYVAPGTAAADPAASPARIALERIRPMVEAKSVLAAEIGLKAMAAMDMTHEERGIREFYLGELRWKPETPDKSTLEHYLRAAELLPARPGPEENHYLAEAHWKAADYFRQQKEAEPAFHHALLAAELSPESADRAFQVAYLFLAFKDDERAVQFFERGLLLRRRDVQENEAHIFMDLAYAYNRLGKAAPFRENTERFIELKSRALKRPDHEPNKADTEALYGARREHANLVRKFGVYAGLYNVYLPKSGDYSFQNINDFYWQPYEHNGRSVQVYLQTLGTLSARYSSVYRDPVSFNTITYVGTSHLADSFHLAAGVRVDPLASANVSLAVEQLVKIGKQAPDDFRLRVAHSWESGLELQPWETHWRYATLFNESVYSFRGGDLGYGGEARFGHSFRLTALGDRLVASPFLGAAWGYAGKGVDSSDHWYGEAGPGVHVRQWRREDFYNAPRSYFDVTLHYRHGLSRNRNNIVSLTLFHSF